MTRPKLDYFSPGEFRQWWPFMSADLLLKLDEFRRRWGAPVIVSGADGALGRTGQGHSQHNIDTWGEVRAIDVFPQVPDGNGGFKYMTSATDRAKAYMLAREIGFTGVGLYTDTAPGNMLHLDVRADADAGAPAKWSRVEGSYLAIEAVLV